MTKKTRMSLEAKLCLLTICTLIVIVVGVGHLSMSQHRSTIIEQQSEVFYAVAHTMALSASGLVAGKDRQLTQAVSARVRNSQMDLVYVVVADKKGHTLYAESRVLPKQSIRAGTRWWMAVRRILGYAGLNPEDVRSVTVPARIHGNETGTLTAGFSLASTKQMIDAVQSKAILAMALGLLVGTILAMAMGRSLANSLGSLTRAARAVSNGDFSYRVVATTGRETEELADAFNFMIESLETYRVQLLERANTDSLTGLFNHRYFQDRLTTELSRAARYEHGLSVLMLDIDFFKSFNDTYGHPMGDAALRELAKVLGRNVRDADVAVRYGGEEFAVLLPETGLERAVITAERIREEIQACTVTSPDGKHAKLTVSIGVAAFPDHCRDSNSLVLSADVALYQAKAQGRNRVSKYRTSMPGIPEADPYKLYVLLHARDVPTIESLAEAVDVRLKFPVGHSTKIARMASSTAKKLGMSEDQTASIYLAALLRDVGQIAMPDAILAKADKLTESEMAAIESHPALGHAIVQKAPHLAPMLEAILHHHERFDGSGYPDHLAGEDIPLPARIISVADAYQSMVTQRPHRRRMTPGEAQMELVDKSSSQFDPKVVQVFIEVLAEEWASERAA